MQTQARSGHRRAQKSKPRPHLELVPRVGMEAVPAPAASQVRVGATERLVRATPADEAAAVVVPGRGCLGVAEPFCVPRVMSGGSKQGPGREGPQVPRPKVCLVLLAARQGDSSGGGGERWAQTSRRPAASPSLPPQQTREVGCLSSPFSRWGDEGSEQGSLD